MDELTNKRIDQLDEGIPQPDDYTVFRSISQSKTLKAKVVAASIITNNFEWTSANAIANLYDIGSVVTRGGKWWQSTVNNNQVVPGVDSTWTEISRSQSGFVKWVAGVFVEDEVFVWNIVGTTAYLFRLKDAARPYVSSNFTTELAADDWEVMGKLEIATADTVAAIALDLLGLPSLAFKGNAVIDGNTTLSIFGDNNAKEIKFFKFEVDAAGRQIGFDINVRYLSWSGDWPSALVWESPYAGHYILKAEKIDSFWYVQIHGPYNN